MPGDYCYTCKRCGTNRHEGIARTEHDMEEVSRVDGNCIQATIINYECKNCDHFERVYDDSCVGRDHVFGTGSYQEFDEEKLEWVTITVTSCGVCGYELERKQSD